MKALLLATGLSLIPLTSVMAQDARNPGVEMFSRFLELLLPERADFLGKLGSPDEYEAPEILPNGDILIRRKPQPLPPPKDGEVDL